jgi:hypothetical protein
VAAPLRNPGPLERRSKAATLRRADQIKILNLAGPRETNEPAIGEFVRNVLKEAFG